MFCALVLVGAIDGPQWENIQHASAPRLQVNARWCLLSAPGDLAMETKDFSNYVYFVDFR